MRSFFLLLLILVTATYSYAQVTGTWYGTLEVQGHKLPLVFHISVDGNTYSATMDSPDQGAAGIKMDITTYANGQLTIEKTALTIKYTAAYDEAAQKLNGTFHQGAASLPLVFTKEKTVAKVIIRPQDPTDFPYNREEVYIHNLKDSVTLAGTLTMPRNKKADKIVILITGSGPQNRDEELKPFNHRPFLVWSDWLTRHGVAVLRYDDRGIAASTGNFKTATSADFANDVSAAIDFIRSRSDLKNMQLGLIGHSEGGMIAPMVAAKDSRVKFLVLLAGPGAPIDELMMKQTELLNKSAGASSEVTDINVQTQKLAYAFLKQHAGEPDEKIALQLKHLLLQQMAKYPAEAMENKSVDAIVKTEMDTYMTPWFRYFATYTPADNLKKIKCPVLAINGKLDQQVDAAQNLPAIADALKKGKNKNYEIVPLDSLNHLFQKAPTGSPAEYGEIEETVNPAALNKVTEWINKL